VTPHKVDCKRTQEPHLCTVVPARIGSVNDHLIEPPMIGLIEPLSGGHFWLSDVVNF